LRKKKEKKMEEKNVRESQTYRWRKGEREKKRKK
jgi:hypothetical protein